MSHFIEIWLLPIFFFLAGKELQHEFFHGTFRKRRDLLIPASAASFGVLIPFLIYKLLSSLFGISGKEWGVVIATDLPLALLALRLFQPVLRAKLRPYLLSLAIFDDLLAILLIALIYNRNGVHPTVFGFLLGAIFPFTLPKVLNRLLNTATNFLIIPLYVVLFLVENFKFAVGILTIAVVMARMIGKPIGILLGDYLARKALKSHILSTKEVGAIGALGAIGLSVSLLFAQVSGASAIAIFSIFATIPLALIRLKVLSATFFKAER